LLDGGIARQGILSNLAYPLVLGSLRFDQGGFFRLSVTGQGRAVVSLCLPPGAKGHHRAQHPNHQGKGRAKNGDHHHGDQ
jgi:hypothetical protein